MLSSREPWYEFCQPPWTHLLHFCPGPSSYLISRICLLALPWTCQVYSNFYPQRAVWLPPLEIPGSAQMSHFQKTLPWLCRNTHPHSSTSYALLFPCFIFFHISYSYIKLQTAVLTCLLSCLFSSNLKQALLGQKAAPSSFTTKSLAPKTLPGTQQNSVNFSTNG